MKSIAAFISSHGFGHACRAIAVLEAVQARRPDTRLQIFTTVPAHLFYTSGLNNFSLHPVETDVGFIQHDALNSDLDATLAKLNTFYPFSRERLKDLVQRVQGCSAILTDISPLGIVVAEMAHIPSVLVENFTWDWIYRNTAKKDIRFTEYEAYLESIYAKVTHHFQTEPLCNPLPDTTSIPPIFRRVRQQPEDIRNLFGVGNRQLVLISLGGFSYPTGRIERFSEYRDFQFILAGQQCSEMLSNNCLALARDSEYYHPDLIAAADLVICKSGYSTVAECHQAGTRIGCIDRPDFAESLTLTRFVKEKLNGTILTEHQFADESWLNNIGNMVEQPSPPAAKSNGADLVGELLVSL